MMMVLVFDSQPINLFHSLKQYVRSHLLQQTALIMYKPLQFSVLSNSRKSNIKKLCSTLQLSTCKIQNNSNFLQPKHCHSTIAFSNLSLTNFYSKLSIKSHLLSPNNLLQARFYSLLRQPKGKFELYYFVLLLFY